MTTFKGKSGRTYTAVEPPLGKGGEGTVYEVEGMPGYVLKIYASEKRNEERLHKLTAMLASPLPDDAISQVTWPVDIVAENRSFMGYVMPKAAGGEELEVIYSDKYNKKFTYYQKISIAKNLCAALNSVHSAGQVCGDLNPNNIVVDPKTGLVTLIDTDSYHITDPATGKIYRCTVGMPDYLPPELQKKMKGGMTLVNAPLPTFTKEADLFGLATHIFRLLMNGALPFSCAVDSTTAMSQGSVTAPQPIDNIANNFFPYFDKRPGIVIPPYAPPFNILPADLQRLFLRAFKSGHSDPKARPTPIEWFNALGALEKHLKQCGNHNNHYYPDNLSHCPWCEIDMRFAKTLNLAHSVTIRQMPYSQSTSSTASGSSSTRAQSSGSSTRTTPTRSSYSPTSSTTKKTTPPTRNISPPKKVNTFSFFEIVIMFIGALVILYVAFKLGGFLIRTIKSRPVSVGTKVERMLNGVSKNKSNKGNSAPVKEQEEPEEPKRIMENEYYRNIEDIEPYETSDYDMYTYESVKDNRGNTYVGGLSGVSSAGDGIATYRDYHNSDYSEIRGRVVVPYDYRAFNTKDNILKIYGDGIVLYSSPLMTRGVEPIDFVVDISECHSVRVEITGDQSIRLVDCGFYKDSTSPTITTMVPAPEITSSVVPLNELDWFSSSGPYDGTYCEKNITDNIGNTYPFAFMGNGYVGDDWQEYLLEGKYEKFTGRVILKDEWKSSKCEGVYIKVYGDGNLLFASKEVTAGYLPEDFEVDVTNVYKLRIEITEEWVAYLVNAYLYKDKATPTVSDFKETLPKVPKIYLTDYPIFRKVASGFEVLGSDVDDLNNTYPNAFVPYSYYNISILWQDYYLDGNYNAITGTVYRKPNQKGKGRIVNIYGDGKLLYKSKEVKPEHQPENFSVNIQGVKFLRVEMGSHSDYGVANCILQK